MEKSPVLCLFSSVETGLKPQNFDNLLSIYTATIYIYRTDTMESLDIYWRLIYNMHEILCKNNINFPL